MVSHVLRVKFSTICEQKFFSIMVNEGTGISNIEQLLFYVKSVDGNLNVSEDFYSLDFTNLTITKARPS